MSSVEKWPGDATNAEYALVVVCGAARVLAVGRAEPRRLWTAGSDASHGRIAAHGQRLVVEPSGIGRAGWSLEDGLRAPCPRHPQGHVIDLDKVLLRLERHGGPKEKDRPLKVGVADVAPAP